MLLSFIVNIIIVLIDVDAVVNDMVVFDAIDVVTIDFILSLLILYCVFCCYFYQVVAVVVFDLHVVTAFDVFGCCPAFADSIKAIKTTRTDTRTI
jgi:hypothetical protein